MGKNNSDFDGKANSISNFRSKLDRGNYANFLKGGKFGGPLIPPGGIGGLGGIQVQNLGGNVPVENHTGSLRQTNNQGLERNELKICI